MFWSIIPLISSDIKPWRWIITANHHLLLANQLARKVFPRVWYTLLVFIWVPFTSHFIPVAFRWWWFWTSFHEQIEENGNRGTIGHQSQWQLEVWSSFHRFVEIHLKLGELQFILKTTEKNKENQNKTKKQKNKKKKDISQIKIRLAFSASGVIIIFLLFMPIWVGLLFTSN